MDWVEQLREDIHGQPMTVKQIPDYANGNADLQA
jgi:hypothetical protein